MYQFCAGPDFVDWVLDDKFNSFSLFLLTVCPDSRGP